MDSLNVAIVYNDIKETINTMAEGLGVAAEHVYTVMVTQQYVTSITWLLVTFIGAILGFISYKLTVKGFDAGAHNDEGGLYLGISIILGIVGGLMIIMGIFHVNTIVTGFVNPEYGAMKEIVRFIK